MSQKPHDPRRYLLLITKGHVNARWTVTRQPDATWPGRPWVIRGPGLDAVEHRAHTQEDAVTYARWRATRHRQLGPTAEHLGDPRTYWRKRMVSGWPVLPAKVDLR